jgi:toxin-antitoxin system PIN domain toxin
MRSLLDINFLIALLDSDHIFHQRSFTWFTENRENGWASCPITQNGCVRVMSNPRYSSVKHFSVHTIASRLNEICLKTEHEFWPDSVSLINGESVSTEKIMGPGQITDIYLLALAASNGGRLVTMDSRITLASVVSGQAENLCIV